VYDFFEKPMIQITPQIKIYLCKVSQDFRKGIDSLAYACRTLLKQDPFGGSMFVFRNRSFSMIKILVYDGQGFWLCSKRLSEGRFQWWPDEEQDGLVTLSAPQLQLLIWNGDLSGVRIGKEWRKIVA
jgi:transposase